MHDSPKISVLLSTYNSEGLHVAVKSILDQTYTNFELVLVNDGGATLTEFVENYCDGRIVLIELEKNIGLAGALNFGIKHCSGKFIARMDDDDYSLPMRLETQLNYLIQEDLDIIGSWTVDKHESLYKVNTPPTSDQDLKNALTYSIPIYHPTFFGKKEVFTDIQYNQSLRFSQDYDFIVRCVINGKKIGNVPNFCVVYNVPTTIDLKKEIIQIKLANIISSRFKAHQETQQTYHIDGKSVIEEDNINFITKKLYYLKQRRKISIAKRLLHLLFLATFSEGRRFLLRNIRRKYKI